jgi:hypothetical protein
VFVWHYAVNAPFADDWSRATLVSDALHHILNGGELWAQYSEARLVVSNVVIIMFGFVNRLNLRTVVLFSALVFVATYCLLLLAFRAYLGRRLTFLPVFTLGIVWFSLVGVSNALWAFQLAWYLVLLFLFAAISFLCIWPRNRKFGLTLAIIAAVLGSISMVQGFLIWPVGLVALLWVWTPERKRWIEVAVWSAAGAVTLLVYIHRYAWGSGCIGPARNCSVTHNASRPGHLASYFLTLTGNVLCVAVRWQSVYEQLFGVVVLAAAVFVIVRSLQTRGHTRIPLPLLMIVFALLFDLTVALGRAGQRNVAGQQGRYTMPNLILVCGILVFAWAHPPRIRAGQARDRRAMAMLTAFVALGVFVVAQGIYGTQYGIRQARVLREHQVQDARTVVNLDRIPRRLRGCYVNKYVWNGAYTPNKALALIGQPVYTAQHDRLMIFEPRAYRSYRAQGLPPPPTCAAARVKKNHAKPSS